VSQSSSKPFYFTKEETPVISEVEEILRNDFGLHLLPPYYYNPASGVKKQPENLLREASVLRFCGIIRSDTVMADTDGSGTIGYSRSGTGVLTGRDVEAYVVYWRLLANRYLSSENSASPIHPSMS